MAEHSVFGWMTRAIAGTTGALLDAAENGARPLNDARGSLHALAMVFAAVASARMGVPVAPAAVRSLAAAEG